MGAPKKVVFFHKKVDFFMAALRAFLFFVMSQFESLEAFFSECLLSFKLRSIFKIFSNFNIPKNPTSKLNLRQDFFLSQFVARVF